jgi:hypothetical protein
MIDLEGHQVLGVLQLSALPAPPGLTSCLHLLIPTHLISQALFKGAPKTNSLLMYYKSCVCVLKCTAQAMCIRLTVSMRTLAQMIHK